MDWNIIGPSFLDVDAKKNEHELNQLAFQILVMIHSQG